MRLLPNVLSVTATLMLAGCYANPTPTPTPPTPVVTTPPRAAPKANDAPKAADADAAIKAERAKLSPEDRALVEAQEWCANETEERLGAMGPPVKVMVKDKPVFVCCDSCQKSVLADPDKTLAKVEELKAKKKSETEKK
jgi:hypothetical protein